MRPIAEQWIAWALVRGQMVHWVDGACRVDPSRLIPLLETLGGDVEARLSRLYLSRGFTLHQLDKQLERLSDELTITCGPLLVVDGLLAMHEDDAIRRIESRYLLRRHLGLLERLVQKHNTAVLVITQSHSACPLHQRRIRSVHRCAQNHLVGMWKGPDEGENFTFHHLRTGIQGRWLPRRESQTCFRIKPRTPNEQRATHPEHSLFCMSRNEVKQRGLFLTVLQHRIRPTKWSEDRPNRNALRERRNARGNQRCPPWRAGVRRPRSHGPTDPAPLRLPQHNAPSPRRHMNSLLMGTHEGCKGEVLHAIVAQFFADTSS